MPLSGRPLDAIRCAAAAAVAAAAAAEEVCDGGGSAPRVRGGVGMGLAPIHAADEGREHGGCLLYTSPSPRD